MRTWRRTVSAAFVAQLLCIVGFGTSMTFMPFYIQTLGVTDLKQVEMWAGSLQTAAAVAMALMAPIWGTLSDRYGRKMMVERAAFGGAIMISLMAFAGNVHQLLFLRAAQGALTGTVAAFITLVSTVSPEDRVVQNLGLMQVAVYSGSSVGPLVGGFVADRWGYKNAFFVTGAMLLIAGLLVHFLIEDSPVRAPAGKHARAGFVPSLKAMLVSGPIILAVLVLFFDNIANSNISPILALYVASMGVNASQAATATGVVLGATAVASSLCAVTIGRVTQRYGFRATLILCTVGAAAAYVPQMLARSFEALLASRFMCGLFIGGTLPTANAIIARLTPPEQRGSTYGVCTSLQSAANAVAPMMGSTIAMSVGMPWVFGTTGVIYLGLALAVIFGARNLVFTARRPAPVAKMAVPAVVNSTSTSGPSSPAP
jgi:DHA1 family multidrug resistance protein-like MFS transporter